MPSFVVGAYASLPQGREAQETYYDLLGEQPWIEGTELPFPGDLADTADRIWLAGHLPKHWRGNTCVSANWRPQYGHYFSAA